jgi:transposase-like protein
MHTKSVAENEGTFQEPKTIESYCPRCEKRQKIMFKVWESSCGAYEDEKFTCSVCGYSWWVDGPDS